jgi:hypothetical protein
VAGKRETSVQDLRHSNDATIVLYTESSMPDMLQTNSKARSESYTCKVNEKESTGIQLEVLNYTLESSSWYWVKAAFVMYADL